ncbi:MAG: hypothetical protein ABI647_01945 [Gemmatimonadota bacterium]
MIRFLRRAARYAWASPVTVFGLGFAALAWLTGGRMAGVTGVLEASGGVLRWMLPRLVPGIQIAAITLGHVVLATDEATLELTRDHERVHVAQYERWGPLFPGLYGGASMAAWARGLHYYRDNKFEIEACRGEPAGPRRLEI